MTTTWPGIEAETPADEGPIIRGDRAGQINAVTRATVISSDDLFLAEDVSNNRVPRSVRAGNIPAAGHGEMYISSSAATTLSDTTTWVDVAGTWTFVSGTLAHDWDMNSNGQLRYIGTEARVCHIAISISASSAQSNKVGEFGCGKNSTVITPSIIRRKFTTAGDIGSSAIHAFIDVVTNDYLTLMCRNITSANNLTVDTCNLFSMSMAPGG